MGQKTDEELTELTARWSDLSAAERRVLLAEVRRRMHVRQTEALQRREQELIGMPSVRVQVQRRYGRVVRKPDGSVVLQTSETQQTLTPVESTQAPERVRGRITFGFGFERRTRTAPEPDAVEAVPASVDPVPP